MDRIDIERLETESFADVWAMLQGSVFHVACLGSLDSIIGAGDITPNYDNKFKSPHGNAIDGYFRKRGCVSVFDYRAEPTEKLEFHRTKCNPLGPAAPGRPGAAIFFLDQVATAKLISWEEWKKDGKLRERVVPYAEGGHPGPIPLANVAKLVTVRQLEDPNYPWAAFRRAREPRT